MKPNKNAQALGALGKGIKKTMTKAALEQRKAASKKPRTATPTKSTLARRARLGIKSK
jgi:hypothetical protein